MNERNDPGTDGVDEPSVLRAVAERVAVEAVEHLRMLPRPWERRAGSGVDGVRVGGALPGVSTKSSPTDVVTAADTAVEALVAARLA